MKCRNCHLREMTVFYGEASLSTGNDIARMDPKHRIYSHWSWRVDISHYKLN